jgi:threonine/homoserine/homoserine lactone efflux protein
MTPEQFVAFLAFTIAAAATPGPSNTLLTATGAQRGLRRGLPALLGASIGMGTLMFVVTLGLGAVVLGNELVLMLVKLSGAAFLGRLAWKIATAGPHQSSGGSAVGLRAMAAFQWVNPKGWLVCLAAAATFVEPGAGSAVAQSTRIALTFAVLCIPCFLPWLAFGAAFQRLLRSARTARIFNVAMGLLLGASVVLLLR